MGLRVTILYGSYREPRMGIRAVKYLQEQLESVGHSVSIVDARACDLPILDKRFQDFSEDERPKVLNRLKDLFENQTDAFIVVAGEYNGTLQPGLKNLMDYFYTEFFHRPCGLVTYSVGALGGARVAMHLLTVINIFGMTPVPGPLGIGLIQKKLDENGQELDGELAGTKNFVKSLEWYGHMFRDARNKGLPS